MKKITILFAAIFCSFLSFAQTKDFTGTWKLKEKTQLSGLEFANALPTQISVSSEAGRLKIGRTRVKALNPRQDTTITETVNLDGTESKKLTATNYQWISKIKINDDKSGFDEIVNVNKPGQPNQQEYTQTERWSISADGRLTIIKTFTPSNGDEQWSVKGIYVKP